MNISLNLPTAIAKIDSSKKDQVETPFSLKNNVSTALSRETKKRI
jgi:hypothetical protein